MCKRVVASKTRCRLILDGCRLVIQCRRTACSTRALAHRCRRICPIDNVGKSELLLRFADNIYSGTYITTIGVDFKLKTIDVNGEKVKLQIWDTAGQDRFRTIASMYYRGTHGVIVVYDVTNRESFVNLKRWLQEIDQNCDAVSRIIVGTRNNCPEKKVVQTEDARRFADQIGVELYEVSAKENINVEEPFYAITRLILQTKKESIRESGTKDDPSAGAAVPESQATTSTIEEKPKRRCGHCIFC